MWIMDCTYINIYVFVVLGGFKQITPLVTSQSEIILNRLLKHTFLNIFAHLIKIKTLNKLDETV